MNQYIIDQINIGDEICYKDKHRSTNSTNWKVTGKLDQSLLIIESITIGLGEKRIIDVAEVQELFFLSAE